MKKILLFIFSLALASGFVSAQTCPGPSQRTALINLQRAGVTESTRAGQFPLTDTCGNLRYAQYTEVNLTPIAYTPTSTGNTANLSEFVITPVGNVWYVDWQGNAILLYSATMATGDKDFLENDTNLPPDNIQDTMYTKSVTTFGGRVYMPGQDVLIIDSVANADFIVNGFRNAQVSVYDNLSQAYAQLSQIGNESKIVLGENSALFKLQSATGTNPVVPAAPFKTLLQYLEADTSWYLPTYPPLRDDAISPSNFLGTDVGGRVVSLPITSIPGAVQAYVYNDAPGTDPGITPDPVAGPFLAYNESSLEEWFFDMPSGFWVLASDPGGYFITSSEFTGTAEPGDPLTLAQQGATTGQALVWDGTQYSPGTVGGGGGPDSTFAKTNGSYLNKRIVDNVYKNGTLGLRTTDTLGVFNLKDDTNQKPQINFSSNSSWLFNSPKDTRANSGLIQDFELAKSFNDSVSTSGDNQVYYMGFNAQLRDPANAGMWLAWENSFNNPGNYRAYELHLPQISYPGGITRRPYSGYYSNSASIIAGHTLFDADYFTLNDYKNGTQKITIGIGDQGTYQPYNQGITFLDTALINFNKNNVGGIYQRNAANSADIRAMYVNSLNQVDIGNNASATKTYEHLIVDGTGLISNGITNGQIRLGDATYPTSLLVRTSTNSHVIALTRTGEIRTNLDLSGGRFQIQNDNNGFNIFDLNLSAPAASIFINSAGNVGIGGTTSPQRKLHVNGEARISDLTTDTPTQIVGSDADGDLGALSMGSGVAITSGVLSATNLYNSNGTTGAARTVTLTDYIRWNLTTNAGTGIAPMSVRVGGTAPNLQSWVATSSNDSLVTKFDNAKGFIQQSNNNIILQNTDANNGITIDETSASVITTGGVVRNASSRLDATSNTTIAPSNSVVVAQPGCTDLALTQIGTTSGLERQGTSHWVTNYTGGTLTITPFAGESINNSSSATIPDGKSAWIMCIGPGDFALMVGQ